MADTTWNEIPWDESADSQTKADEFDRQYAENRDAAEQKKDGK